MILTLVLGSLASGALLAAAEDEKDVSSRGIVRKWDISSDGKPQGKLKQVARFDNAIGIHFKILLLDPDGKERVVPANHEFKLGQQFRLEIEAENDLYLYVLHEGSGGKPTLLVPDPKDKEVPKTAKGKKKILPDDGSYFEFVPPAGTERLRVYACSEQKRDLEIREAFEKDRPKDIEMKTRLDKLQSQSETKTVSGKDIAQALQDVDLKDPAVRSRGVKVLVEENHGQTAIKLAEKSQPDLYHDILLHTK